MRNLFIITIFLILSLNVKSQNPISEGNYLKQPGLDKFVGTWVYSDDTISFKIRLRIDKVNLSKQRNTWFVDLLQGDYTLSKNGKSITNGSTKDTSITSGGFVDRKVSERKVKFIFFDKNRKLKGGEVIFELLEDNLSKAKWTMIPLERVNVGKGHFDHSFSIPRSMILTKE